MMGGCYVEKGMGLEERCIAWPVFLRVSGGLAPLLAALWLHPGRCSLQGGAGRLGKPRREHGHRRPVEAG